MVSAGPLAAANTACGYRLRNGAGQHHLRRDRREVLDLPGGKHPPQGKARTGRGRLAAASSTWDNEHVDAEEGEVQKTAARPPQWQGLARWCAGVWRLRVESDGAGLDHRSSD